jgi:hypothetical protein
MKKPDFTDESLITDINENSDIIDAEFQSIDAEFQSIDAEFQSIDAEFQSIDAEFQSIDAEFQRLFNAGAAKYYPNVINRIATVDHNEVGAWVIHSPVGRLHAEMFRIHVHGYLYNLATSVDFYVVGYTYSAANGNVDEQPGAIISYSLQDNGNDGYPKYVGIDANGFVAVAIGAITSQIYFGRLIADMWSFNQTTRTYKTGWTLDLSTTAGFGWLDIHGPLAANFGGYLTVLNNGFGGISNGINVVPTSRFDIQQLTDVGFTGGLRITRASAAHTCAFVMGADDNLWFAESDDLTNFGSHILFQKDGIISAMGYVDRTPAFVGNALTELAKIKADANGKIDHSTLPEFAKVNRKENIYKDVEVEKDVPILDEFGKQKLNEKIEPIFEKKIVTESQIVGEKIVEERNIGNMVSILVTAFQQQIEKNKLLEERLTTLEKSIKLSKNV